MRYEYNAVGQVYLHKKTGLSYVVLQEGSKNKFRKGGISHE